MSFSEMIKILENFLSFLDFAVSLTHHFYSPGVRIRYHKLHGSTLGLVLLDRLLASLGKLLVSLGRLLVSLDRLPTAIDRLHCTMRTALYTSCKYTELTSNVYSYFCNARILGSYLWCQQPSSVALYKVTIVFTVKLRNMVTPHGKHSCTASG